MLSLAVLCAFHYFLADILGNNLFLSQFFFCLLSFPFLKSTTSLCIEFTQCFGIPVDQWVRDCNDKIKAFLLCLKKQLGGHKAESYCLISMLLPCLGSESGQDFEARSAYLALGIFCSVQRGGSQCSIKGVTFLETRNSQFSSEYHKYMPKNIHNLTSLR